MSGFWYPKIYDLRSTLPGSDGGDNHESTTDQVKSYSPPNPPPVPQRAGQTPMGYDSGGYVQRDHMHHSLGLERTFLLPPRISSVPSRPSAGSQPQKTFDINHDAYFANLYDIQQPSSKTDFPGSSVSPAYHLEEAIPPHTNISVSSDNQRNTTFHRYTHTRDTAVTRQTGILDPARPAPGSHLIPPEKANNGRRQPHAQSSPASGGSVTKSYSGSRVGDDYALRSSEARPPRRPAKSSHTDPRPPSDFKDLDGYRGCMNSVELWDCFDDCRGKRFGGKGFTRRGNLFAHLRTYHGQTIPKGG